MVVRELLEKLAEADPDDIVMLVAEYGDKLWATDVWIDEENGETVIY